MKSKLRLKNLLAITTALLILLTALPLGALTEGEGGVEPPEEKQQEEIVQVEEDEEAKKAAAEEEAKKAAAEKAAAEKAATEKAAAEEAAKKAAAEKAAAEKAAANIDITVSVAWSGVPSDTNPSIKIHLLCNSAKVNNTTVTYPSRDFTFPDCAKTDENGVENTYTLLIDAPTAIEGYTSEKAVTGTQVSVTYAPVVLEEDDPADKPAEIPAEIPSEEPSEETGAETISGAVRWTGQPEGANPGAIINLVVNDETVDSCQVSPSSPDYSLTKPTGEGRLVVVPEIIEGYDSNYSATGGGVSITYYPATPSVGAAVESALLQTDKSGTPNSLTVTVGGSITWNGVPEGAQPSLTISLSRNGELLSNVDSLNIKASNIPYLFPSSFDAADDAGVPYSYSVSAVAEAIDGYTVDVAIDGYNVTVTYAQSVAGDEVIQSLIDRIDALPSLETIGQMVRGSGDHSTVIMTVMKLQAELNKLSDKDKERITNLARLTELENARGSDDVPYISREFFGRAIQSASVTLTVVWNTTGTSVSIPSDLTVTLNQDGVGYGGYTIKPTSGSPSQWTHTISGLPKSTVAGHAFKYTVTWPAVQSFTLTSGDLKATYTATAPTKYTIKVTWSGETGHAKRPSSVKIKLNNFTASSPSTPSPTVIVSSGNSWTATVEGTVGAGQSVTAEAVDPPTGYTANFSTGASGVINVDYVYTANLISIAGNIYWPDTNPGIRPRTVSITLWRVDHTGYREDIAYLNVDAHSDNKFAFANYPAFDSNGRSYRYAVVQSQDIDFVTTYERVGDQYNVINHYQDPAKVNLRVEVSWKDNTNSRGKRPRYATLHLYRDGKLWRTIQVNEADQWVNYFTGLPYAHSDGTPYKYTVRGDKVPHYYWRTAKPDDNETVHFTFRYGNARSGDPTTTTTTTTTAQLAPDMRDLLSALGSAQRNTLLSEYASASGLYDTLRQSIRTAAGNIDFSTLRQQNPQAAAWLTISGTALDYPLMQGSDNAYYLTHLYNRNQNRMGAPFIDANCISPFSSRNTVIYGRNMQDGSMFATLLNYRQQSYYDANPTATLSIPNATYMVEFFAAFTTNNLYSDVARMSFTGDTDFLNYLNTCRNKSVFRSNISLSSSDRIITLVTSLDSSATRFVLMGRLVPYVDVTK